MNHYVMLTRISPESHPEVCDYEKLAKEVSEKIRRFCPEVKWVTNYAVLGPYDYLDIFEAPDDETAARVAMIVRSAGHAVTETWSAVPWRRFEEMTRELSRQQVVVSR